MLSYPTRAIPSPSHCPNIPTPAEQNSILTQKWQWVPTMKCSLLQFPNSVYIINSVTWDGYTKLFSVKPLTNPRGGIMHDILEHELVRLPREEDFRVGMGPRPEAMSRISSSSSNIGPHGQALGIGVSTIRVPEISRYQSGGGSEFSYSQYGGPHPQQFSNDRYQERYNYSSGGNFSSDCSSEEENYGRRNGVRGRQRDASRDRRKGDDRNDKRGHGKVGAGKKVDGKKKEKSDKGRAIRGDSNKKGRNSSPSSSSSSSSPSRRKKN